MHFCDAREHRLSIRAAKDYRSNMPEKEVSTLIEQNDGTTTELSITGSKAGKRHALSNNSRVMRLGSIALYLAGARRRAAAAKRQKEG